MVNKKILYALTVIFCLSFPNFATAENNDLKRLVVGYFQNIQMGNFQLAFEATQKSYLNLATFKKRVESFKVMTLKKVKIVAQGEKDAEVRIKGLIPSSFGTPFPYETALRLEKDETGWKIVFIEKPLEDEQFKEQIQMAPDVFIDDDEQIVGQVI